MKKSKEVFREYKIIKISRNNKFYWRSMYRNDNHITLFDKIITAKNNKWQYLYVLLPNTDILYPAEFKNKFGAMRRIIQDKQMINSLGKYEIFDEIIVGKIKIKK